MTQLAILSDIHGNLPALEAVRQDMAQFDVDHVIVAGDIINWGPFSVQVVERVAREGWAVIRGNNEFYLLDYNTPRAPAEWNDHLHMTNMNLLPWLYRQLSGRWQHVIASWPDTLSLRYPDAPPIRVVHGSPRSHWQGIFPTSSLEEMREKLSEVEETTLIAAHTHLAMDRAVGRWHILNPGTVGVPLDGETGVARYMLLESNGDGWHPIFRRVAYDVAPLFQAFECLRFVETCGVIGHLIVNEFKTARLHVLPFNHWRHATHPTRPASGALLDEFYRTVNIWDYTPIEYHNNLNDDGRS
jgi:predicted phosphodiesterase